MTDKRNASLFALLLVAVAVTHYGVDPLCTIFPALSAKALFYVFRGVEGAIIFAVIGCLRPILLPVCIWGAVEEGETAVCRLVVGPLTAPPPATPWAGLCSDASQWPLYMLGIVYLAALVYWKTKNEPESRA